MWNAHQPGSPQAQGLAQHSLGLAGDGHNPAGQPEKQGHGNPVQQIAGVAHRPRRKENRIVDGDHNIADPGQPAGQNADQFGVGQMAVDHTGFKASAQAHHVTHAAK